ncbi:hypothetical protein J4231_03060 [Candidatus Woesearchaeota archaeon]|nr:hypothetical protein [Candidatus Woesearchaeota archaeon]
MPDYETKIERAQKVFNGLVGFIGESIYLRTGLINLGFEIEGAEKDYSEDGHNVLYFRRPKKDNVLEIILLIHQVGYNTCQGHTKNPHFHYELEVHSPQIPGIKFDSRTITQKALGETGKEPTKIPIHSSNILLAAQKCIENLFVEKQAE